MLRNIACAVFLAVFCLAGTCYGHPSEHPSGHPYGYSGGHSGGHAGGYSSGYRIDALRNKLSCALEQEARPGIYREAAEEGEELPGSLRFHMSGFGRDHCVVGIEFPERVSDRAAFIAARRTVMTIIGILNRHDYFSSLTPDAKFQAVAVPCVREPGGAYYYDGYMWNWVKYGLEPPVVLPKHAIEKMIAQ